MLELITRVEVGRRKIIIICPMPDEAPPLLFDRARMMGDDVKLQDQDLIIIVTASLKGRGRTQIVACDDGAPATATPTIDLTLLKALVRAEAWKTQLLQGEVRSLEEICVNEGIQPSYGRRMVRLAFLAPSLKAKVLEGKTPAGMTLQTLMVGGVPLTWTDQLALFST